jgi:hypothetical protein
LHGATRPKFHIGQELETLPYPLEWEEDPPVLGGDRCIVVGLVWSPSNCKAAGWVYHIAFPDGCKDSPWVKPGHRDTEHERLLRPLRRKRR